MIDVLSPRVDQASALLDAKCYEHVGRGVMRAYHFYNSLSAEDGTPVATLFLPEDFTVDQLKDSVEAEANRIALERGINGEDIGHVEVDREEAFHLSRELNSSLESVNG